MARLPTRKSLQSMKRVDLQKICKDFGVKANLKSEALIDLLLETQSLSTPQLTRRSVSTRQSSRQGPSRITSMIVHDIDKEENEERENPNIEEAQQGSSPVPPRTRKARETQTRLGVGRPLAVGGQGPRAVTRSSGGSRGKEVKLSKSHNPKEPTIQEEPEVLSVPTNVEPVDQRHKDQSNAEYLHPTSNNKAFDINSIVENAVRPLQDQVKALKLELEQMRSMRADIAELQLKTTTAEAQFEGLNALSASVISLKDDLKQVRESLTVNNIPSRPSTPKPQRLPKQPAIAFGMSSSLRPSTASLPAQAVTPLQTRSTSPTGPAMPTTLGKRRRANNTSEVVGEGQEGEYSDGELASSVVGPNKKRLRTARDVDNDDDDNTRSASSSHTPAQPQDTQQNEVSNPNHGVPAFTVFTDSEEPSDYLDPPPPTDHLPDFFQSDSLSASSLALRETKLTTATTLANTTENQPQSFNFSFLPISSTPLNTMYMPSFPYPDPPQSPSPAGANLGTFRGRHTEERTDIFKEFGFPSPTRLSRSYGVLAGSHQDERGGFVNPAALTQQGSSGRQKEVSSNEVAAGLGLTAVRTLPASEGASGLEDHPPIKRTMYGTELDGDTRFGDFGVEGVATGFWSAGKI